MVEEYFVSKKYHEISLLAVDIAKQVSKNGEEWMKYLSVAARLYRYSFEDQLLIYAQRPEARACATMETWNEKMFCWVNRGAKGIALFDRENEQPRLKYVFDVSDVHKARGGKDLYLWEMREEHKDVVLHYPDSHARLVELLSTLAGMDMAAFYMDKVFFQILKGEKRLSFHSGITAWELRAELV